MVEKKISDIKVKNLKRAQGFLAVLDLLGITEDELLLIKDIKKLSDRVEVLEKENEELRRIMKNTTEGGTVKKERSVAEIVKQYQGKVEDFNLNG